MGSFWNYFDFCQEGVCSEENSLWKTGWDAHVAPSTQKFRYRYRYNDPLADLEPKPGHPGQVHNIHISAENQWEVQWAPSPEKLGLSATAFLWASLGLDCKEGWKTELHVARSGVSSGLGSNPSWFAPKPHTISGLQLSQVLLKGSQTLVNLAWTLHWKGKSKIKLSSCLKSFCPSPILMPYKKTSLCSVLNSDPKPHSLYTFPQISFSAWAFPTSWVSHKLWSLRWGWRASATVTL